jgi:hypothetical protein
MPPATRAPPTLAAPPRGAADPSTPRECRQRCRRLTGSAPSARRTKSSSPTPQARRRAAHPAPPPAAPAPATDQQHEQFDPYSPGTGKTHLAIAIGIRACLAGQRVAFATATEWVARLADAKRRNALDTELRRLSFIPLLVVDEVGYIPFDPEAANLMFSLVSARYERASLVVTSNKPFSAWGEIFGDEVTAVAMIDRLVHHAEILSLKGDSYRLRDKDLGAPNRAKSADFA